MFQTLNKFKIAIVLAGLFGLMQSCQKLMENFPSGGNRNKTIAQLVSQTEDYKLLKFALARTGLTETLNRPGTYTVFAPNNRAFADAGYPTIAAINSVDREVLKSVLLYHVLGSTVLASQIPEAANTPVATLNGNQVFTTRRGTNVFVNGVSVVVADIRASNGVIHGIDRVLLPPPGNIVELASHKPNLTYLVAAVVRASQGSTNVAGVLSGEGPLTVFAPTNQAFIAAGFPTIESINAADPAVLTSILTYHVIAARLFSSDLVDNSDVATVNGGTVKITLGGGPKVKGNANTTASNITATDIVATNGVVHVIDQVLLP